MAIASIVLLILRGKSYISLPSCRLFTIAFLSAWIPIILSLPDAIDSISASRVALSYPRFYLAGLFIIYALDTAEDHLQLLRLSSVVLMFWIVDGYVQLATGTDLLGYQSSATRINALFGDGNPKFAIMLTTFSPFLFEYVRREWNRISFATTIGAVAALVLLAGTRASWITLAVIFTSYLSLLWARDRKVPLRAFFIALIASTFMVGVLYFYSERFAVRVDSAIDGIRGETEIVQNSVSHRVFIWNGAVGMIGSHPINGVGARGFRHAFALHAVPEDPFVNADPPIIPTHSHQLLLEILAETGLLGFAGMALMLAILARAAKRAGPVARKCALAYGLCLVAAYFPFNTHLAIYSSIWSQVIWWLVAVYCAGISLKASGTRVLDQS